MLDQVLSNEMTKVIIDRTVPMPDSRVVRKYPHGEMEIGDSFFIKEVGLQVVLNANWRAGKRLQKKFIARKDGEGVRVWRTA
jgi:hypothetical protein